MAFSVYTDNTDIFPVIHLVDDDTKTKAIVYSFGGLLNAFVLQGKHNLIDGFSSCTDARENITNGFKSCKLSPFVCRITKGEYIFNEQAYKTGRFFLGEEAIHGLLYDATFRVINYGADETCAFVSLRYDYARSDEGFPFTYSCTITYRLEKQNKISIITKIKNSSDAIMPLSDGWHPYFTFGSSIHDLLFQINAGEMLEFDNRLVPTGRVLPFHKFHTPDLLGETFFDNCFILNNTDQPACVLKNNEGLRLSIWPDESYPYLQVYTPEHRRSIAIENLSSAPNAFNNGIGLICLKPGEMKKFSTAYQAEIL